MALDLNKSVKVNLGKNEKLDLTKGKVGTVTSARLALGWDEVSKKGGGLFGRLGGGGGAIDLDASILMLDANRNVLDTVFYGHETSNDGSIRHSGDNLTGAGEGDDETIYINLNAVSPQVAHLACVITSYTGQSFDQVENVFCRLDDVSNSQPVSVVKYDLNEKSSARGIVMAVVSRTATGWEITAKGAPISDARTPKKPEVVSVVQRSI